MDMVQVGGKPLQELLPFPVLLRVNMELNHFCLHCFLQGAVISFEMNKK